MHTYRPATHVFAEKIERPPCCLFDYPVFSCHQWRNDVDALSNISHADVFALSNEDVEPDCDC